MVGTGRTGCTGAAQTFFTLGIAYFLIMLIASFFFCVPAEGWQPEDRRPGHEPSPFSNVAGGWVPSWLSERVIARLARITRRRLRITREDVHVSEAHKTPQFYLLWIVLCFNVTAGIGVIGVAKTTMTDIFGSTMPHVATPAFAASYVTMISVFNMGGRFLWASISDYLGRKNTWPWPSSPTWPSARWRNGIT